MIGLTDRIRLRPLTAATKGDILFLSSEEAAIRLVCPDVERAWIPMGGEPIIGRLGVRPDQRKPVSTAEAKRSNNGDPTASLDVQQRQR